MPERHQTRIDQPAPTIGAIFRLALPLASNSILLHGIVILNSSLQIITGNITDPRRGADHPITPDHGPPADFVAHFAEPLSSTVIFELLGVPADGHKRLSAGAEALFSLAPTKADLVHLMVYSNHVEKVLQAVLTTSSSSLSHDLISARFGKANFPRILPKSGHERGTGQVGAHAHHRMGWPPSRAFLPVQW